MSDIQRKRIMDAVKREREYQDKKWGSLSVHNHTIWEWIDIMQDELNEARLHNNRGQNAQAKAEILQVIAVGFACLEQHGALEGHPVRDGVRDA